MPQCTCIVLILSGKKGPDNHFESAFASVSSYCSVLECINVPHVGEITEDTPKEYQRRQCGLLPPLP